MSLKKLKFLTTLPLVTPLCFDLEIPLILLLAISWLRSDRDFIACFHTKLCIEVAEILREPCTKVLGKIHLSLL